MLATLSDSASPPNTLTLWPTPEMLPITSRSDVRQYNVIDGPGLADVKVGGAPTGYTLTGTFSGSSLLGTIFAPTAWWRRPADACAQIETWKRDARLLRYIVTLTDIDDDVKVSAFDHQWGDLDHVNYTLTLVQSRPLLIGSIPAARAVENPAGAPVVAPGTSGIGQHAVPEAHTVAPGDTLEKLAAYYYGSMDAWWPIYLANQAADGSGPIVDWTAPLEVGWVLHLPGGQPGVAAPGNAARGRR